MGEATLIDPEPLEVESCEFVLGIPHVYIHVCVYVYIYVYIYTKKININTYIYTYIHMYLYIQAKPHRSTQHLSRWSRASSCPEYHFLHLPIQRTANRCVLVYTHANTRVFVCAGVCLGAYHFGVCVLVDGVDGVVRGMF